MRMLYGHPHHQRHLQRMLLKLEELHKTKRRFIKHKIQRWNSFVNFFLKKRSFPLLLSSYKLGGDFEYLLVLCLQIEKQPRIINTAPFEKREADETDVYNGSSRY